MPTIIDAISWFYFGLIGFLLAANLSVKIARVTHHEAVAERIVNALHPYVKYLRMP